MPVTSAGSNLDVSLIDWPALHRMREGFLSGTSGGEPYWKSESDLSSYEATFAQRIGWKWDHVLGELNGLGWTPPSGPVLDWGTGTGIAHRRFFAHFGVGGVSTLVLVDRSPMAVRFAARLTSQEHPDLAIGGDAHRPSLLLVSHVISELDDRELADLVDLAASATAVIWVEPGEARISRALIGIRERLRGDKRLVAPCTHQETCGLLSPGAERHWCHHFATTPPGVFTDRGWARFAGITGIDLRSVPLSYLVLDKRDCIAADSSAKRLIGRPRVNKPEALAFCCDSSGVSDVRITRRRLPEVYRSARKNRLPSLVYCRVENGEAVEWGGDGGSQPLG